MFLNPYRRLDPSKKEIRLLEILPAQGIDDPVQCRLATVRLGEHPDFIGVSSLYGSPKQTDKVWLNGRSVTITLHLVQALRHIRAVFYPTISLRFQRTPARKPHGASRWLRTVFGLHPQPDGEKPNVLRVWLDVLCVNQQDETEKSRQLAEMKVIFKSAELVVGWLGVKGKHTDVAMQVLAEIEDAMPPNWGDPGDRERNPQDYSPTHKWAEPIKHIWADSPEGQISFTLPHWVGCNDFMERQYFQRRWILEELALARFPAFLLGDILIPWKQVLRLNRMMEEFKSYESNIMEPHLRAMIADLPLETAHKLLDEFSVRAEWEEAKIILETSSSMGSMDKLSDMCDNDKEDNK